MVSKYVFTVCTLLSFACFAECDLKIISAIAHIQSEVVSGNVTFTLQEDGNVRVYGTIEGLPQGAYGFHVHAIGDPTNNCLASGAHYNPEGVNHGGPDHEVRHVGDLGNVVFGVDNTSHIDITDHMIDLNGDNSIIGRTLVLHEEEDDLGLAGHEFSLTTGNAGARIGCGIIGVLEEERTNSANILTKSLVWWVATFLCLVVMFD